VNKIGFGIIGACFLAGLALATPAAHPEPYLIQPEDDLRIKVWRHPDLDTEVTVGANGTVNLPLLGKVQVAGMTPEAVEDNLAGLWAKNFLKNPYVSVSILNKKFFVLGEVKNPGSYEMGGSITILKALSMAGGLGDYAAQGSIYVLRENSNESKRIDVDVPAVRSGEAEDFQIQPGDVINVPQSLF